MGETYILSMNEANTIEMMDYCGDKLKTPSYIKNGWFKIDLPDQLLKKELINDLLRYDEKSRTFVAILNQTRPITMRSQSQLF